MNTQPKPTVACPRCNRKQQKRGLDAMYFCENCRCQFDADPNEGGDFSDRNPAARIEREERRKNSRRSKR